MIRRLALKDRHTKCPRCNYYGCSRSRERHGEVLGHWYWYAEMLFRPVRDGLNLKRQYRNLKRWWSALNYDLIEDVELDGIDTRDYPDFCDAYVASATYKGREMTSDELDRLNEDSSYVYECVMERLH